MKGFRVEELTAGNAADWTEFNDQSRDGSFYHTLDWRDVIAQDFGLTPQYFMAYQEENVVALCPLFEGTQKAIRQFHGLIPPPRSDHRHLVVEKDELTPKLMDALIAGIVDHAQRTRMSFVKLAFARTEALDCFANYGAPFLPESGTMQLHLAGKTPDSLWNDTFTKKEKQRTYIKRFEKDGCDLIEAKSTEQLELFYEHYRDNIEFIGGSAAPLSHFQTLRKKFGDSGMRITLLQDGDLFIGGLLSFISVPHRTMYLRYLSLNRKIPNKFHPPYYLYWDAIKKAFELGFETVCFGTTANDPDNKSFRLKRKFGCVHNSAFSTILPTTRLFASLYSVAAGNHTFKRVKLSAAQNTIL